MNIKRTNLIKIVCSIIIVLFSLFGSSCTKPDEEPNFINQAYLEFPQEMEGLIKDKLIYVTSIGQDSQMIKFQISTLEKQDLFEYNIDTFLDINKVEEGAVVFVFVGCSIKSLSESGATLESEMDRAKGFVEACNNKKITLITIHAGGTSRRGSTSDSFIELMFSNSTFNIFVEAGNFDNFLTISASKNNVPCYQIPNSISLKETVIRLYGD